MAVDPTELKAQLDVATAEIQALKESAQKQKAEWEQKLKEESYEAKLLKYQQLYKEPFRTLPTGLPNFSPLPTPPGGPRENTSDVEELSPLDEHLQSSLKND